MTQMSFSEAEYAGKRQQTRREIFLAEMEQVVRWVALLALIEPVYPKAARGRHPYPLPTMLRVHLLQNWFGYSDPAMEEALYEVAPLRRFAGLSLTRGSVPDETTILNFRRLLETHDLAPKVLAAVSAHLTQQGLLLRSGMIVDATIIHAPPSTKNRDHARDAEMHQAKRGQQWYFGMKAHIGVGVESGLVHTLTTTAANAADVTEIAQRLHGRERSVWADAGHTGAEQRGARPARPALVHRRQARAHQGAARWGIQDGHAADGIPQGCGAGARGTSISRAQAPVRLHQGALQGPGQEHRAVAGTVRVGQPVAGAQAPAGGDGIIASAFRETAERGRQRAVK